MTRAWLLLSLLACGCGIDEPTTGSTATASTVGQGVGYQGVGYQGTSYQGTSYRGTSYDDVRIGSLRFDEVKLVKTSLQLWRQLGNGTWEQRTPDRMCMWNASRTSVITCTTVPSGSPSPLAGARFRSVFFDAETGLTRHATLRIGKGTTDADAVIRDPFVAMHPGYGGCTFVGYGEDCGNPRGCRTNCDLFVYEIDIIDTNGIASGFCKPGERAIALPNTWDETGARTETTTKFTFACTNGTIAKCTRWGYRPFEQTATNSAGQPISDLSPYHAACVRAATADYCASGLSFTKENTLIDISDYAPHAPLSVGFIPGTVSVSYVKDFDASAFVWESEFDKHGATALDFVRYTELGTVFGGYACPDRFQPGTAPAPDAPHQPMTRTDLPTSPPVVSVHSTTACAHGEQVQGRYLHPECSRCTMKLWQEHGDAYPCLRADGGWSAQCVADAAALCTVADRLASHGECSAGSALNLYDTACTLKVCSDPALASCCESSWTAGCASAANRRCRGGRENVLTAIGFCGVSLLQNSAS